LTIKCLYIPKEIKENNMTSVIRSPAQLGHLIKERRKALGLTQKQLAEMAAIGQPALSEFETDPKKARIETAFALLTALGLDIWTQPRGTNNLKEDKF
jgi:HTH-type transcriptional regulator/antitoxin HipB